MCVSRAEGSNAATNSAAPSLVSPLLSTVVVLVLSARSAGRAGQLQKGGYVSLDDAWLRWGADSQRPVTCRRVLVAPCFRVFFKTVFTAVLSGRDCFLFIPGLVGQYAGTSSGRPLGAYGNLRSAMIGRARCADRRVRT